MKKSLQEIAMVAGSLSLTVGWAGFQRYVLSRAQYHAGAKQEEIYRAADLSLYSAYACAGFTAITAGYVLLKRRR